ncbi:MAG: primosomal protein N', partial [Steroidobacteraceae bacterium]
MALDTPLRSLFDYLPPVSFAAAGLRPGMRVRVPFGRRRLVGVVMEVADTSDVAPERLKPVLEVLDSRPVLDTAALGLIEWAAEYYHHPIGQVVSAGLPRALRLGAPIAAHEERWTATAAGAAAQAADSLRRAPRQ